MSSIVSRRPPRSGLVSQANDLRCISIRLGTSRTFCRRAKLRRVRGACTVAKVATPRAVERGDQGAAESEPTPVAEHLAPSGNQSGHEEDTPTARPLKIAHRIGALSRTVGAHGPRPRRPRMWRDVVLRWAAAAIGRPPECRGNL